jgi:hypothetical protein
MSSIIRQDILQIEHSKGNVVVIHSNNIPADDSILKKNQSYKQTLIPDMFFRNSHSLFFFLSNVLAASFVSVITPITVTSSL